MTRPQKCEIKQCLNPFHGLISWLFALILEKYIQSSPIKQYAVVRYLTNFIQIYYNAFFLLYRNFQTSTDAIWKQGTEMPSYWPRKRSRGRWKRHAWVPELTARKHTRIHAQACTHAHRTGMHQSSQHSCGMMGNRDKRMRSKISHLELDTWE